MTDLTKLLAELRRPETSHVDMLKRQSWGTLQWFLENDIKTHPIHNRNHLEFISCGEKGFAAIEKDLSAATSTIDLVLWGFDPGMELVRTTASAPNDAGPGSAHWPRGTTYGDLLTRKARMGVKVRLLLWYDNVVLNKGFAGNVPDLPATWMPSHLPPSELVAPTHEWLKTRTFSRKQLQGHRADYCTAWWRAALSGRFPNLEVRTRGAKIGSITANITKYLPDQLTLIEGVGSKLAGTHHQKPILIDYEPGNGKPNTCAYVMGLNSVTDYWDTTAHLYNDPRREFNFAAGAAWKETAWHVKPYRDYAIRVQGEALHNINENFVEGWDRAESTISRGAVPNGNDGAHGLQARRRSIQPKDIPAPHGARHRAQIVRTQPEKLDATILKAYILASSNAVNYIYVENQYVQLTDWPKLIKKIRGRYRDGMKAAKADPSAITPLHLFVVMPQPERGQMVPRTYETIGQLGAAEGMGEYHNTVQGKRKADELQPPKPPPEGVHPHAQAKYNKDLRDWLIARQANDSAITRDSAKAVPPNPKAELEALGIKSVVAMLMTYDAGNEARNIRINKRDSEAQDAQAEQEARTSKSGKASDVDDYGVDITPKRYREIYIHSKLMFVDDVYTTLGSANLNARSMVSDSEFNICTADYDFTQAARREVWGDIAGKDLDGGDGSPEVTAKTHKAWVDRMEKNKDNRKPGNPPENGSFIHPFEDPRGEPLVRLA
jgi:phosphatidylserine/phosphatidylglycerophosphate/cardiolipin synthase-like enzyme